MEELISPKELSKLLKVSKPWPYVMVERGLLPYYKIGVKGKRGIIRFRMNDIEAYLKESRIERKG